LRRLQETRIQHRNTRDAQRVRDLINKCGNDCEEEDTDDECDLAPAENTFSSVALTASSSSTLPWLGATENGTAAEGQEEGAGTLAYPFDAGYQSSFR
jgi:hypothetical protein